MITSKNVQHTNDLCAIILIIPNKILHECNQSDKFNDWIARYAQPSWWSRMVEAAKNSD